MENTYNIREIGGETYYNFGYIEKLCNNIKLTSKETNIIDEEEIYNMVAYHDDYTPENIILENIPHLIDDGIIFISKDYFEESIAPLDEV